ncbi:MAG: PilC/PilY family type IV pilus protein [Betaproteobacteria bacterium]
MDATKDLRKRLLVWTAGLWLAASGALYAQATDLSDGPLAQPATSVKPNMLLILDDSGSMARQFTPDYVSSNSNAGTMANCFDSLDGGTIVETPDDCFAGDPPAMTPDFNTQYYNPEIRYFPAVSYDGSSKGDMTSAATTGWTLAPTDNVSSSSANDARKAPHLGNLGSTTAQSTHWDTGSPSTPVTTMDLVNGYPDRVWCVAAGDSATDTTRCKINSGYTYPEFTFGVGVDSSGNRKYKLGAPYYYRIIPSEFCTNSTLTVCKAGTGPFTDTDGTVYSVPARVRFCDSTAHTNCQAKRTSTFRFPKFLGTVNSASPGSPGVKAQGKIILTAGDAGAPTIQQITLTKPDASLVNLLSASVTTVATNSAGNRTNAATAIRDAINANTSLGLNHGYAASLGPTGGATQEIRIDAPVVGVVHNGTTISVNAPATTTTPASLSFSIGGANTSSDKVNSLRIGPPGGPAVDLIPAGGVSCGSSCTNTKMAGNLRATINANTTSGLIHGYTATGTGATVVITAPASTGSERNGWPMTWSDTGLTNQSGSLAGGSTVGDLAHSTTAFTGGADIAPPGSAARVNVGSFVRTNIVPGQTYPKGPARSDCAGATACTYEEEMTNFANWFAYYRTRFQMAKTSIGRAFLTLGSDFRVGFMTINFSTTHWLPVDEFTTAATQQKDQWFAKLYNSTNSGSTPLRGALARAGRYYGNQNPGGTMGASPIQQSCQPSYSILTSDGYWNDFSGYVQLNGTTSVGNQDSGIGNPPAEVPPYATKASGSWDGLGVSNTLADVALYYYKTDLRTDLADQVPASGKDNAPHQHMTTFTVGMGLAGTFTYDPNYETQIAGDFKDVTQGTKFWPNPGSQEEAKLDDLWHAAVNGRGKFFSAQDPVALANGIAETLNSVQSRIGAGAAAATSNLQPVAGDNFAFTAQYQTVEWSGDLKARTIDLSTGTVATRELWSAQALLDQRDHTTRRIYVFDAADSDPAATTSVFNRSVTSLSQTLGTATASATGHGFTTGDTVIISGASPAGFNGTFTITVVDANTFRFSVSATLLSPATGTVTAGLPRNQNGNKLRSFCVPDSPTASYPTCTDGGMLTQAEMDAHFDPLGGPNGQLFQSVPWPSDGSNRHLSATKLSLVDYLRGETVNETSGGTSTTDLYRNRAHLLGDIVNAQPAYVKAPPFQYSDANYGAFRSANLNRFGMVYAAANDGMLHAFATDPDGNPYFQTAGIATPVTSDDTFTGSLSTDPVSGEGSENWAYIPSMVFPTLKRLAETNYSTNHRYSVDGSPVVADVCFSPCAAVSDWRTIIVGGLNKGGRGYYALDVTNPQSPKALWELKGGSDAACALTDAAAVGQPGDCHIGFTFGNPVIAKRPSDGKWVVFVTSGHNNVSPGDGQGHLYVVDAQTGLILQRMTTGVGDSVTPSGLTRINGWVDNASVNNTVKTIYGGDLLGNIWRFQLEAAAPLSANTVYRLGTVTDPAGTPQPITTRLELGQDPITLSRLIFVATGKFLGTTDKVDEQRQTVYAIKDPMTTATLGLSRPGGLSGFRQQTFVASSTTRSVTNNTPVDFASEGGWYIDLPDGGTGSPSERVNVDPILQLGTLVVPSNVPSSDTCVAGGFGWVNFFDFRSGGFVQGSAGAMVSTKISASLVVGINVVRLPGGTVKTIVTTADNQQITQDTPVAPSNIQGRRVTWRELFVE